VSSIVEIYRKVTPSQRAHAFEVAASLRSRGYKEHHLDDLIFRIAAQLGEQKGGDSSTIDMHVDAELVAADELNMSSMERQLEFLAAHYVTREALVNAVESALSIDYSLSN
jgi:hypothetical protein